MKQKFDPNSNRSQALANPAYGNFVLTKPTENQTQGLLLIAGASSWKGYWDWYHVYETNYSYDTDFLSFFTPRNGLSRDRVHRQWKTIEEAAAHLLILGWDTKYVSKIVKTVLSTNKLY
jgi:hypothetical protein